EAPEIAMAAANATSTARIERVFLVRLIQGLRGRRATTLPQQTRRSPDLVRLHRLKKGQSWHHTAPQLLSYEALEAVVFDPVRGRERRACVAVEEGDAGEAEGALGGDLGGAQGHPPGGVAKDVGTATVPRPTAQDAAAGGHRTMVASGQLRQRTRRVAVH